MAKARQIRKRVVAVKNIRTITKTMEMIASARYRRAHDHAVSARPYTDRVTDLVGDLLAEGGEKLDHPLLHENEELKKDVLLVLTSNRGLCGGYNASVLALAIERFTQLTKAGYQIALHVAGKRGIQYLRSVGLEIAQTYTELDFLPSYAQIGRIAHGLMQQFLDGKISGLEVAYMQYLSSGQQQPAISQILPLSGIEPPKRLEPVGRTVGVYDFSPSAETILRNLLPATVRLRLWQCFLDASVTEQMMRSASMRAASDNADEMIEELSLKHNRMRQAQITSELAEIMGGRAALE